MFNGRSEKTTTNHVIMIRKITCLLGLLSCLGVFAQNYVHQVFVLNEGYFDFAAQQQVIPVSLGTYDPFSDTYSDVATINGARFASDVEVGNGSVYVAADTLLLKYDKDTYQLQAQVSVPGIRKIAYWNNQILLTRGELGGLSHYFEARSATDLSLQYTIDPADGLSWSCEDIHVENNMAYLAIGNAFDFANLVGKVGMVDLLNQSLSGTIDLGPNGLNPENIMVKNGELYTLNNKDFTSSSISKIDMATAQFNSTQDITINSGCGASVMADDHIYYQEYNVGKLARYDYGASTIVDTLVNTESYYGLLDDPINDQLYATKTDFTSSGELRILAYDGTVLNSKVISVSAGNLAMDVRSSTGVEDQEANDIVAIYLREQQELRAFGEDLEIYDSAGQLVAASTNASGWISVSMANKTSGVYTALVDGRSFRFMK